MENGVDEFMVCLSRLGELLEGEREVLMSGQWEKLEPLGRRKEGLSRDFLRHLPERMSPEQAEACGRVQDMRLANEGLMCERIEDMRAKIRNLRDSSRACAMYTGARVVNQ